MRKENEPVGFSLPGGVYREENWLEINWDEELILEQIKIQKSKLILESYKRLSDQYLVLYMNPEKPKCSLSKKLDVKYIYNMSFSTVSNEIRSQFDYGISPAVIALREYQVRTKKLEISKKDELKAFEQKADNVERFFHSSFYTNKERYLKGRMSQESYYDELFWRNYYESEITSKYESEVSFMERQLKDAIAASAQDIGKSKPVVIEKNDKMRYMPVGEAVYLEGTLMALVVYKTPQEITEVEWKSLTDQKEIAGVIYKEKVMMRQIPSCGPLLLSLAQMYKDMFPAQDAECDCTLHCTEKEKNMWNEARMIGKY